MCRLVAVVASAITEFGLVLKDAPRSLARLSREHPDGWGVAAHGSAEVAGGWHIEKGTARADECRLFQEIAARSSGTVLIAHVRQKTVGPTRLENTHPFFQSGWVFAHNGTITDQAHVRAGASAARLAEVRGDTDSEVLFAYFLTRLDEAGLSAADTSLETKELATRVLARASDALRARKVGAFNFLLSNGESCFVHRCGRTLFSLDRVGNESTRSLEPPSSPTAAWTQRRPAVLVASERLTDEPWVEVPDGSFLRMDRSPAPMLVWHAPSFRSAPPDGLHVPP